MQMTTQKNLLKASQTPGNHYLFLQCLKMQAANSLRPFSFFLCKTLLFFHCHQCQFFTSLTQTAISIDHGKKCSIISYSRGANFFMLNFTALQFCSILLSRKDENPSPAQPRSGWIIFPFNLKLAKP